MRLIDYYLLGRGRFVNLTFTPLFKENSHFCLLSNCFHISKTLDFQKKKPEKLWGIYLDWIWKKMNWREKFHSLDGRRLWAMIISIYFKSEKKYLWKSILFWCLSWTNYSKYLYSFRQVEMRHKLSQVVYSLGQIAKILNIYFAKS